MNHQNIMPGDCFTDSSGNKYQAVRTIPCEDYYYRNLGIPIEYKQNVLFKINGDALGYYFVCEAGDGYKIKATLKQQPFEIRSKKARQLMLF